MNPGRLRSQREEGTPPSLCRNHQAQMCQTKKVCSRNTSGFLHQHLRTVLRQMGTLMRNNTFRLLSPRQHAGRHQQQRDRPRHKACSPRVAQSTGSVQLHLLRPRARNGGHLHLQKLLWLAPNNSLDLILRLAMRRLESQEHRH